MKKQLILCMMTLCLCLLKTEARSKYVSEEEDNPYEFGFTVDGQQHRHEKKDANGIIQGEFGFITADGIYHVTVYATDENGNFKILSMRNVRVSGPLDEPNAKLPDTSQFSKGQPGPAANPLSINTSPAPVQTVPTVAVTESNRFTTQSTIKPACAGCGYVTHKTPLNMNNNKIPFQTQAGQNPKPGSIVIGNKEQSTEPQQQLPPQQQTLQPTLKPHIDSQSGFNIPPGSNAPFVSNPGSAISNGNQGQFNVPSTGQYPNDPNSHYQPGNNDHNTPSTLNSAVTQKPHESLPNSNTQSEYEPISSLGKEVNVEESTELPTINSNISENKRKQDEQQNQNYNVKDTQPLDTASQKPSLHDVPSYTNQNDDTRIPIGTKSNDDTLSTLPLHNVQNPPLQETIEGATEITPYKTTQPSYIGESHQIAVKQMTTDNLEHYTSAPLAPTIAEQAKQNTNENPTTKTTIKTISSNVNSDNNNFNYNNDDVADQPQHQQDPLLNPLTISNPNNHLMQPGQQDYHAPGTGSVDVQGPSGISVSNGQINVPNNPPIQIQDKYPNMVDGLPQGITEGDITDLLYRFNYTVGFHGHYEKGYKNGAKVGGYFVNDRDGVSRIVTYVADENGYRPKVKFIRLDLNSDLVPKEGTEKTFGLKNFEFVWYPLN